MGIKESRKERIINTYVRSLAPYLSSWVALQKDIERVRDLAFQYPISGAGAFFLIMLVSTIFGAWKSVGDVSVWGLVWKSAALIATAVLLFWILRLDRMKSLVLSWIKTIAFLCAFGVVYGILLASTSAVYQDNSYYLSGLSDAPTVHVSRDPIAPFLLGLIAAVVPVALVALPTLRVQALPGNQLQTGELLEVKGGQASHMWQLVRETVSEMNSAMSAIHKKQRIGWGNLRIFLVRQSAIAPGIISLNNEVALLAPRGFILLATTDSMMFKSILAHELAHVFHYDTRLWHQEKIVERAHWHRTIPMTSLGALGFVSQLLADGFQGLGSLLTLLIVVVVPYEVWEIRNKVRRMKQDSEVLADMAACLAVGVENERRAVEQYAGHSDSNLDTTRRLSALDALNA